jgi:hypothetical protein
MRHRSHCSKAQRKLKGGSKDAVVRVNRGCSVRLKRGCSEQEAESEEKPIGKRMVEEYLGFIYYS